MLSKLQESKTLRSMFWVATEKFGYSLISFISIILLARILTPEDFGIIGSINIFITVSMLIVESGLGGALVKKEEVSMIDYNTVFVLNLIISILVYIVLFISSPYIADFFNNTSLSLIIKIIGINIILGSLSLTYRVKLIREAQFKKISKASILSLLFAVFFAYIVAINGLGVWAIIAQQIFYSVFFLAFIFFATKMRLSLKFSKTSFLEVYNFGAKILLSSFISMIYSEGISSMISKKYNFETTGYYTQATKLISFPLNVFKSLGDSVVFPLLSTIKDEKEFKSKSSNSMQFILIVSVPFFIVLHIFAEEIVLLVLGDKWIVAGPYLKILSLSAVASTIDTVSRNILKATGNGNTILKSEIIKRFIGGILLLYFFNYNLEIVLYAIVFINILGCIMNIYFVNKITSYNFLQQFYDIILIVFLGIISALLGHYATEVLNFLHITNFIFQITVYLLLYFALAFYKIKNILKII